MFKIVYENGQYFEGRNGGTKALIDTFPKITVDLEHENFPIIACRKQNIKHYINEFLWEINGSNDINDLNNKYVPVDSTFLWKTWANKNGKIDYSYGDCWRNNNGIDQIEMVENQLKNNPMSRRMILSLTDTKKNLDVDNDSYKTPQVPPCHVSIVFTSNGKCLNAVVLSRSQDIVCGLPGDIIRYSLLVECLARISNLKPGKVSIVFANVHYYKIHEEPMLRLLEQKISSENNPRMTIATDMQSKLSDFNYNDFNLCGYKPNKFVSMPLIP